RVRGSARGTFFELSGVCGVSARDGAVFLMQEGTMRTPRGGTMRRTAGPMTLLAILCAGAGCASSLTFPDREPTIRGDVVGIEAGFPFDGPRTIWVKETPDAACGIVFRVDDDTEIGERTPRGDIAERRFENIGLGYTLNVWSGAVAESCPGQAVADVIEIIPRLE
ncbi:MAG: hypothetical protein R3266_13040, partial [Gemmatimonadota bacterium]|nr:hypothetical protein [Gemmatimonadota bacterium]